MDSKAMTREEKAKLALERLAQRTQSQREQQEKQRHLRQQIYELETGRSLRSPENGKRKRDDDSTDSGDSDYDKRTKDRSKEDGNRDKERDRDRERDGEKERGERERDRGGRNRDRDWDKEKHKDNDRKDKGRDDRVKEKERKIQNEEKYEQYQKMVKNNQMEELLSIEREERPTQHWSKKPLSSMSERDWRIFREDYNISTRGGSIPHPMRSWAEASDKCLLAGKIMNAITMVGYKTPTPIQMQAIPVGLQGRDLIGIAETGSGKTAAFIIPMLQYLSRLPPIDDMEKALEGPYALILAPTRELAQQISVEADKFSKFCKIKCVLVVGGLPIEEQAFQLRKGCEVVIATPGRLFDCIESRYVVLNQCFYVVLDEADRMIDMGFEPQVNRILDVMPATNLKPDNEEELEAVLKKQMSKLKDLEKDENTSTEDVEMLDPKKMLRITTMYSATMPVGVERLARKFLRKPAHVIIGEVGKAVDRIEQRIEWIKDEGLKMRRLQGLLEERPDPPILIFVNTKKSCDDISKNLNKAGWRVATLHSGKGQVQRDSSLSSFKDGNSDILIATDVASRGIDVPGIRHVINFDMPKTIDDYVHRIGRTARAGNTGTASSFVTPDDTHIMYDLNNMLTQRGAAVPKELSNHPSAQCRPGTIPDKKKRRDTIIYTTK